MIINHTKKTTTAPDSTGLSVLVALKAQNPDFPNTFVADTLIPVGHCDTFPTIESSSREVKEYEPINDRDFTSIVSTGPIKYDEISLTSLYDPSGSDGVNELYKAYKANDQIGLVIELYDNGSETGTLYSFLVKITKLSVTSEKGGKVACEISAKIFGEPVVTAKEIPAEQDGEGENAGGDTGENTGEEPAPQITKAIYYGSYAQPTIDEENAKTLTKIERSDLAGTYTMGSDDLDSYLFVIYPKEWGAETNWTWQDNATKLEFALEDLAELTIDGVEYFVARSYNELPSTTLAIVK